MSRKKKKKGAWTVDRKEKRLSKERNKVTLYEMKKGVHPYGKRGGPTLRCLIPPHIKIQDHLRQQPTVPQGTTSSLEELDLCIIKWRTQTRGQQLGRTQKP
jgi:hypothetical protein